LVFVDGIEDPFVAGLGLVRFIAGVPASGAGFVEFENLAGI
jgi:hypothetical protein